MSCLLSGARARSRENSSRAEIRWTHDHSMDVPATLLLTIDAGKLVGENVLVHLKETLFLFRQLSEGLASTQTNIGFQQTDRQLRRALNRLNELGATLPKPGRNSPRNRLFQTSKKLSANPAPNASDSPVKR